MRAGALVVHVGDLFSSQLGSTATAVGAKLQLGVYVRVQHVVHKF